MFHTIFSLLTGSRQLSDHIKDGVRSQAAQMHVANVCVF